MEVFTCSLTRVFPGGTVCAFEIDGKVNANIANTNRQLPISFQRMRFSDLVEFVSEFTCRKDMYAPVGCLDRRDHPARNDSEKGWIGGACHSLIHRRISLNSCLANIFALRECIIQIPLWHNMCMCTPLNTLWIRQASILAGSSFGKPFLVTVLVTFVFLVSLHQST